MRKTPILDTEPVWTQPILTTPDIAELWGITEAAVTKRLQKPGAPQPAVVDGRRRLWSYAQILPLFIALSDIELVDGVAAAVSRRQSQLADRAAALQATIQKDLDEIEVERSALDAFVEKIAPTTNEITDALTQLREQIAEGAAALRAEITDYTGADSETDSEAGAGAA